MSPNSPSKDKKLVSVRLDLELYDKLEQLRYENGDENIGDALKRVVREAEEPTHRFKYASPRKKKGK